MSATETKEKASPVKENTSSNEEKAITEKNEATSTLAEKNKKMQRLKVPKITRKQVISIQVLKKQK